MAAILVVDDVEDYGSELCDALSREGHNVVQASGAKEAITKGLHQHPEVLLCDWMLSDHVNGLDVISALRIVNPSMRAILMTGFASEDLRRDAGTAEVFEFLEKPLQIGQVRESVQRAALSTLPWKNKELVGYIEATPSGGILYRNAAAEELFGMAGIDPDIDELGEVFSASDIRILSLAYEQWLELNLNGRKSLKIQLRARSMDDGQKSALLFTEDKQHVLRNHPNVYRLLGLTEPKARVSLRSLGHILVLDDFESVRRVTMDVLREANCICHTAKTLEEAVRIFSHDSEITLVILDFEVPNAHPMDIVRTLKGIRPDVRIIGTSGGSYAQEFRMMGIDTFLPKPWGLDQFLDTLQNPSMHA